MKLLRRILSLGLCCILAASLLCACAPKTPSSITGDGKGQVVMTYITMLTEPADMAMVEEAISKKLNDQLGITVDFYPLSILEQSKYTTIIGGGERLDLMCVSFTDPTEFANVGMIKKLTEEDIRNYAPDIAAMVDAGVSLYVHDTKGNIIGISTKEIQNGYGGSYVVRKSDLEAVGLADKYPDQARITYDDLDLIFAKLKEKFPDSYPSGNMSDVSSKFSAMDGAGSSLGRSYGVLNLEADPTSTKVVNYYETAEYKEYLSHMQDWFDKGYVYPDALTSSDNNISLFASGKFRGTYLDCWPMLRDEYVTRCGEPVVQLQLMDPYEVPISAGSGITWCICGTAQNPAAALRLLNQMMIDQELMNTFQWGIEGTHYEIVDKEACVIDFPDGLDASTSGFYNTLGLYGDKSKIYAFLGPGQTVEDVKAMNELTLQLCEKAREKKAPVTGFYWDSSNVTAEIAAVDNVIAQYAGSVGIGQNKNYDEFIAALKDAGIDKIIADKQAQLDAYFAANKK